MKLQTSIDFVKAEVDKNKLVISSERPLEVLSSAVLNGGFTKANKIISIHVPLDTEENADKDAEVLDKEIHEDPEDIIKKVLSKLDIAPDVVVGIMTNADVRNVEVSIQRCKDITLTAFVTAGVEVAATAGESTFSKQNPHKIDNEGTINIILLIDGDLTESCMVDAVKTVTEAKTVALRELDVRSYFSGDLASGTVTDSVVVACTKRGKTVDYAGTGTVLGELIGKSVIESLKKALLKEQNIIANRSLTKRLEERGISLAKAITLFLETRPKIAGKFEQFNEEILQTLSDPKVVSLVIAGLRLDDDLKLGLIPKGTFDKSVAVKTFQTAVINYLCNNNPSKDLKLDDTSLAAVENLGPFTGSILVAIMNNVYSGM
ncbi:MAG: adenosylcobinamide amidohydrolase [Candidatus Bathyarchaeum sp.]|nr:MAG: adenosylcobinamide amidohydrolase [Candidatus Bathyarchaeum sp.]